MTSGRYWVVAVLTACCVAASGVPAAAETPPWAKQAVRYLKQHDVIDGVSPNRAMTRAAFKEVMKRAFGGGFNRKRGKLTAADMDRALVRALDRSPIAEYLDGLTAPDGWSPGFNPWFGTEVVAREMGLRHDRPTDDEANEASATERIKQADIAYAVWRALTSPSTYGADILTDVELPKVGTRRRKVIAFALSLVGTPYVYAGEWINRTPDDYPYGTQTHGGFDCSGFVWFVLQRKASNYRPVERPYRGWSLPERSSSEMAKATEQRLRAGKLKPGDVMLFAPDGRSSKPRDVYHAGLYLGHGWMVHSSGSRAGASISAVGKGSWWRTQFLFGRRVID